jgi:hypothetical protein
MRAQKLAKKAHKAGLADGIRRRTARPPTKRAVAAELFRLAELCQARDWSAEDLLRAEAARHERAWRRAERKATRPS